MYLHPEKESRNLIMAAPLLLPSLIMAWFFFLLLWEDLHQRRYTTARPAFYSAHQKLAFSCAFANPFDFITCDLEIKESHSRHFLKLFENFSSHVKFLALGIWHGVEHARVPSGPVLRSGVLFSVRWKTVHPSAWLFDPAPSTLTVRCVPANITSWWSGWTVVSRR